MSDQEKRSLPERLEEKLEKKLVKVKRSLGGRVAHVIAWIFAGFSILLLALVTAFSWYSTTADFNHRVNKAVVNALENATGGRVELKSISFRFMVSKAQERPPIFQRRRYR
jgi:translocation and assembly module TamB